MNHCLTLNPLCLPHGSNAQAFPWLPSWGRDESLVMATGESSLCPGRVAKRLDTGWAKSLPGLLSLKAIGSHQALRKGSWGRECWPPTWLQLRGVGSQTLSFGASRLGLSKDNNECCPVPFHNVQCAMSHGGTSIDIISFMPLSQQPLREMVSSPNVQMIT